MIIWRAAICLCIMTGPALAAPAQCPIREVHHQGDYLTFGGYKIHLLNPDGQGDPGNPPVWQGMTITKPSGAVCNAEIGIIEPPFFLAGTHYLYIDTYSGSEHIQGALNVDNCDLPWASSQYIGPPKLVGGDEFIYDEAKPVEIGPDCLPIRKGGGS